MNPNDLNELIAKRRAIFPNVYSNKPIPTEILQQIVENGNWAPTHKRTEPWRFRIIRGESLKQMSEVITSWYTTKTAPEDFSEMQLKKMNQKPLQSAAAIAIVMKRDPKESLPEWEELAAVAAAVQNMWLTCTAYGIGTYWASPKFAFDMGEFLQLEDGETCYGFMYMGYPEGPEPEGKRGPIEDKVVWLD
ncbi:MAG: nitroreductase [Saprospiraceae bacterium]